LSSVEPRGDGDDDRATRLAPHPRNLVPRGRLDGGLLADDGIAGRDNDRPVVATARDRECAAVARAVGDAAAERHAGVSAAHGGRVTRADTPADTAADPAAHGHAAADGHPSPDDDPAADADAAPGERPRRPRFTIDPGGRADVRHGRPRR